MDTQPDQPHLPGFADRNDHAVTHESEDHENEAHTMQLMSNSHTIPKLPTSAPPIESLLSNEQKSSFAAWRMLVAGASFDHDTLPVNNEEAVKEGKENLTPDSEVKESDGLQEPLTPVIGIHDKSEKNFKEKGNESKAVVPEFPSFRSHTLAAVTAPATSEPVEHDDFVRPHLPPQEAISDVMMSFLDNEQMQTTRDSSNELDRSNLKHATDQNEVAKVQLADLTEHIKEDAQNDDTYYFDLNHDKELDDVLFFNNGKSTNLNFETDDKDKPFTTAAVDDGYQIHLEPVKATEEDKNQSRNAAYILNGSHDVFEKSDHEFLGNGVADVEVIAPEDIIVQHLKPGSRRSSIEDLVIHRQESIDKHSPTETVQDIFVSQRELDSSKISDESAYDFVAEQSEEEINDDLKMAAIVNPTESNLPHTLESDNSDALVAGHIQLGAEHDAAASNNENAESLLQYAKLAQNALRYDGKPFTFKNYEPPVVYDEIANESEKTDPTSTSVNQAIPNAAQTGREKFDDRTYDFVAEQSEEEIDHDLKIAAIVNGRPMETKQASLQHQSNSEDQPYDSVVESDQEEANRFGSSTESIKKSTDQQLSDSVNARSSVLDEPSGQENSAKFFVDTSPITEDWLTQLISQPLVETKPDFQPMRPATSNFQQLPKRAAEPGVVENDDDHGFEEPVIKVARNNLQGKIPLFHENAMEINESRPHDYFNAQNLNNNQSAEAEKKHISIQLEELSEADEKPPPLPPFTLALPKQLDNDTKVYIKTMAREQRERLLLSIADGTVSPGSTVQIEDPVSGKIIEVAPKDFVQVIKENPVQENEYDYLQGAASALDRYEIPSQRSSYSPQTPQAPQIPPFYPRGYTPRHSYDEFDKRPGSLANWDLPPTPAPRTRFDVAAPPSYNHHMNLPPPPTYLDQHQSYPGIEMTPQSAYPYDTNKMHPQSPTGYPPAVTSTLNQPPHQDPHAPPYPLYNLHPQALLQPQPQPQVQQQQLQQQQLQQQQLQQQQLQQQQLQQPQPLAPQAPVHAQPNVITVTPAPEPTPRTANHEDYREEDERRGRRHRSSDEDSEKGRKTGRYQKRQQQRRPSTNSLPDRNRRDDPQQDCMKRNCCCWIVVVTLMVLIVILAAAGYFVWIHYWKQEPNDSDSTISTTPAGHIRFL